MKRSRNSVRYFRAVSAHGDLRSISKEVFVGRMRVYAPFEKELSVFYDTEIMPSRHYE